MTSLASHARAGSRPTARELQVIRLAASGMGHREIAARLGRSPWTVRNHLRNLYTRLGVGELVEALNALGWIVLPDEAAQ